MKRMQVLVVAITCCIYLSLAAGTATAEEKKNISPRSRMSSQGVSDSDDAARMMPAKEEEPRYPLAVRVPTALQGAPTLMKLRNKMIVDFQKGKEEEALIAADKIEKDPAANAFDRATAIQVKLLLVTKKDNSNHAAAIPLLEDALAADGLSNNNHYALMLQLAQRYLMEQDYQNALDAANKFTIETKTEPKEILLVKGNAQYRLKKPLEAIVVLEKAHVLDFANTQVTEMLARAYSDTGQLEKAAAMTKTMGQTAGNDRAARMNLAITYLDAKQYEQAADVIAELRTEQQLKEERDYLTAMYIYSAMKNKEDDIVAVVQEGLEKGILKPTASHYNVLAEAYYYSNAENNVAKAIENWTKAAPISKDGATYLNLSIVQCQEEMWNACKESAKNAIVKGGINANDAKAQIAKADKGLGKTK